MPRIEHLAPRARPSRPHGALLASLALLLAQCDQLYPERTAPFDAGPTCSDEDTDPEHTVAWDDIEMGIIQRPTTPSCYCHLPTASPPLGIQMGGLDLESYDTMIDGGFHSHDNIVVPGHPCESVLYLKLVAPPFGARMPKMGGYLSPHDIALVHDWIAEGAHEY